MSQRLALITGGTSGIGLAIAKSLAKDFDLALSYRSNGEKAQEAMKALKTEFPETQVKVFPGALTDFDSCNHLYQSVVKEFGKSPAVLVNSAGQIKDTLLLTAEFEDYFNIVNEHLKASMALTQLCLKPMYKERWGRVINLSSISAQYAKRGQSHYAAAKAGIEGFTKTVALEVAHRGVTVNAIAPGLIRTPMTEELVKKIESDSRGVRERIPVGRLGEASEVGALAAFLCSEQAGYITGTVVTIDGGRSLGDAQS